MSQLRRIALPPIWKNPETPSTTAKLHTNLQEIKNAKNCKQFSLTLWASLLVHKKFIQLSLIGGLRFIKDIDCIL
jgi:hypothetical protein